MYFFFCNVMKEASASCFLFIVSQLLFSLKGSIIKHSIILEIYLQLVIAKAHFLNKLLLKPLKM